MSSSIKNRKEKTEMQEWLKEIPFSHFITIEPTPSLPFKLDEIQQRMRLIEFWLNKRYLKSSFSNWKDENRFWMVGFKEGGGLSHSQTHYHILLHSPDVLHRKIKLANIGADLQMGWMLTPSKNPFTGKMRSFSSDGENPLDIQQVENITATTIYCSKWINRVDEGEDFFFITPPRNIKPILVAV